MKISTTTKNKIKKRLFAVVFFAVVWQLAYMLIGRDVLFASPVQTARRLLELLGSANFYLAMFSTIFRITSGFIAAVALGVILASLCTRFEYVNAIVSPVMSLISATPVASFIILALVWIQSNELPIFITFLMVLPIVWGNTKNGIISTDRSLLEMAQVYKFNRLKKLSMIYIPSVMPYFMAAFTTGLGLGWKAGVAAEIICLPRHSIGIQLNNSKIYLETLDLFAWTAAVIIISVILRKLLVYLALKASKIYSRQVSLK